MRYDVLLESDAGLHPRHFSTVYAAADDDARRLVARADRSGTPATYYY